MGQAVSAATPFFEDVSVGDSLPTIVRETTYMQQVVYAGQARDYFAIHHDRDTARAAGLPDVIILGSLKAAFLGQVVTTWGGSAATLKELEVQYRGIDVPGKPLTGQGVVRRAWVDGDAHLVECDIWLVNADGVQTTRGRAIVALPSRAGRPV